MKKKDWKNFIDYEIEINKVIGNNRILPLCTYSLDRCKASEVIDVVQTHQFALIMREGKLEFIESFGRKRAEDEIKRFASFPQLNPNPVLEIDPSGKITFCNDAASRTLKELNVGDAKVFLPHDLADILNVLESRKEAQFYREVKLLIRP